jgi:acetyltransferase
VVIESLGANAAARETASLVVLLQDAVESGASVGFLPPLGADEATAYWRSAYAAVRAGARLLLVAREDHDALVGSAQLALRPNALHRAEVQNITTARRRGIGRALMVAVEGEARRLGRTTLVLDTRQGDPSEGLYLDVGYQCAGIIPRYAKSATGVLDGSAFYYKLLT